MTRSGEAAFFTFYFSLLFWQTNVHIIKRGTDKCLLFLGGSGNLPHVSVHKKGCVPSSEAADWSIKSRNIKSIFGGCGRGFQLLTTIKRPRYSINTKPKSGLVRNSDDIEGNREIVVQTSRRQQHKPTQISSFRELIC